ncbi:MAG: flagellar biosynthesis protein FlhB [Oscillospiraceae bacterium]|nr:flagellar biosynthesis protein FlhB [Oscillospiraceae bacterium]
MPGEKTEKATPKRKQDERKKGNIFKSQDLITAVSLLVTFYSLQALGPFVMQTLQNLIKTYFGKAAVQTTLSATDVRIVLLDSIKAVGVTALPLLLIAGLVAIVVTMAQTRMLVTGEAIKFKMSHLNPIQGLKKMFSMRGVVELVKASAKITVLLYLVYNKAKEYLPRFAKLMDMTVPEGLSMFGEFIMSVVATAGAIFMLLSAADYAYQWWEYEKNLRMSKQEIKEEYKNTEGDPQIKGKIKERQRKQAMSRMMQSVPQADVVVRNPTHFAVAIGYNPDNNRAPVVLAKGADLIAMRIVQIAEENKITTLENKPLARGLYDTVEVGREIPEQFYQPVAEVLAFVYSLKEKELK